MKKFDELVERTMTIRQRLASAEKAIIDLGQVNYENRKALEKIITGLEILIYEAKEVLNDPDIITAYIPSCGVGSSGPSSRYGTK